MSNKNSKSKSSKHENNSQLFEFRFFHIKLKTKYKYKNLNFVFKLIKNTKWHFGYTDSIYSFDLWEIRSFFTNSRRTPPISCGSYFEYS